jgi:hypothetical protein
MNACRAPIEWDRLVDYWLGDTDAKTTDEHLLGCDACGSQLDALIALRRGVKAAFDAGTVGAFVSAAFVRHLAASGKRVREYRVAAGGSVACGIAPDDDLVVGRLQLPPITGATRLDALVSVDGGAEQRVDDVPFDVTTGEVLSLPPPAWLRAAAPHRRRIRLLAVSGGNEHVVGDYLLDHRSWPPAERP